jgi:hypothetical protein
MAVRRDPVTKKVIPLEPPPDHLLAERWQFISLRLAKARASGCGYDRRKVIAHAKIDWKRKQQAERNRYARTVRLESLINEPAVESHEPASDATLDAISLIASLSDREKSLVILLFLSGHSRERVASILKISLDAFDKARCKALDTMRLSSL